MSDAPLIDIRNATIYRGNTTGMDVVLSGYLASVGIHGVLGRQITDGKNIVLVTHLINEIPPDIDGLILLREGWDRRRRPEKGRPDR